MFSGRWSSLFIHHLRYGHSSRPAVTPKTTNQPLWRRLGLYAIGFLIVGTILIILADLCLAYLWF